MNCGVSWGRARSAGGQHSSNLLSWLPIVGSNSIHMSKVPTNVPFEEWVSQIFAHAVEREGWYWAEDVDSEAYELNPVRLVAHTTQLCEKSASVLAPFTDAQVDQGFWFLVGSPSELDVLGADVVPLPDRLRCIRSIFSLFEECFAIRCTSHLSHMDESGVGPMNSICYMWWDFLWHLITQWRDAEFLRQIPVQYQLRATDQDVIDAACISVMESILEIPSIACQESAIHGLGHWGRFRPERCHPVIAAFFERHPDVRPELRRYALKAQSPKGVL